MSGACGSKLAGAFPSTPTRVTRAICAEAQPSLPAAASGAHESATSNAAARVYGRLGIGGTEAALRPRQSELRIEVENSWDRTPTKGVPKRPRAARAALSRNTPGGVGFLELVERDGELGMHVVLEEHERDPLDLGWAVRGGPDGDSSGSSDREPKGSRRDCRKRNR